MNHDKAYHPYQSSWSGGFVRETRPCSGCNPYRPKRLCVRAQWRIMYRCPCKSAQLGTARRISHSGKLLKDPSALGLLNALGPTCCASCSFMQLQPVLSQNPPACVVQGLLKASGTSCSSLQLQYAHCHKCATSCDAGLSTAAGAPVAICCTSCGRIQSSCNLPNAHDPPADLVQSCSQPLKAQRRHAAPAAAADSPPALVVQGCPRLGVSRTTCCTSWPRLRYLLCAKCTPACAAFTQSATSCTCRQSSSRALSLHRQPERGPPCKAAGNSAPRSPLGPQAAARLPVPGCTLMQTCWPTAAPSAQAARPSRTCTGQRQHPPVMSGAPAPKARDPGHRHPCREQALLKWTAGSLWAMRLCMGTATATTWMQTLPACLTGPGRATMAAMSMGSQVSGVCQWGARLPVFQREGALDATPWQLTQWGAR